ncbi:HK97 gp10 family phage protein [Lactococcus insecticola]|uniref:Phage protein n=1 Tax=Pseudolactococcus insecticola TaxID=2709158 RepID=A0A6A0B3X1_9LACT|nr:HK97 gp10 family phage protein [Lactococcus insecticola]GFH39852.1 hypothetical protein Hs20B_02500 [Lactococcus insecticola]
MSLSSLLDKEVESLMTKLDASLAVQVANAETLSPVDTGELKASWVLKRDSTKSWTVKNTSDHALFQEFGTYKQAGREMFGLRSGRWKSDVIKRIK